MLAKPKTSVVINVCNRCPVLNQTLSNLIYAKLKVTKQSANKQQTIINFAAKQHLC